jgi:hypothetical protein
MMKMPQPFLVLVAQPRSKWLLAPTKADDLRGAWGRLLRDHTAAQVMPFALLVPFVGAVASSVVPGERFEPLRPAGMITVVCGIAIMLLSGRARSLPEIA